MLREESIELRLQELDVILNELAKYKDMNPDVLRDDLSQRWIIEKGLEAGAELIFEVGDHILSSQFVHYADTYEDTLKALFEERVISEELYQQIKGLGSLRNILVHRYLQIDLDLLFMNFHKALLIFPLFAQEIAVWLKETKERSALSQL